ncbi:PLDc N-terminal domain-containing protein [Pontibacter chinhatensis]|uniref:Cardiolipin synthase N-terminal domain-containing protein n=1 Tax=Pontibacter chinhatensis TaxID=1436961 RepID=A0A1I2VX80_9BACT|nr:PLDc N-terminal domain-containing protein [Pontibacter chinhatensis]SFG93672.1 hypothetical protein SAMN05421739_104411 [Pontibacter chinhatensis]
MELVSAPVSMIIWQMFMLLHMVLFMTAWAMILLSSRLNAPYTLAWMLGTLLLPVVGPVIFFMRRRSFS